MKVEIIETGSSGNCFLFNYSIIIDMGLPMSRLKDKIDFSKVTHILLTHIHGDHFHKTTLSNIHQNHKHIIFVCGEWLFEDLRLVFGGKTERIEVIDMNKLYKFGDIKVAGFNAVHNAPNCGYRLINSDGHKHIHVTDISTLYGLTAQGYDTATIECNYEDVEALEFIKKAREDGSFSHLTKAMKNHLSVHEVISFCKDNNIGQLTPIHIGQLTKKEVYEALKAW